YDIYAGTSLNVVFRRLNWRPGCCHVSSYLPDGCGNGLTHTIMVKTDQDLDQKETLSRLQLLMFLRVGLVSLLLGVAIVIQVRETRTYFGEILNAHYFLITLIYFLSCT
ncbi:MAG: hypothetical protein JRF06_05910, partial [Deltaproteobacteria bacterium]|nr:hypothetical protein [Deltaproteobacteria bacterium]